METYSGGGGGGVPSQRLETFSPEGLQEGYDINQFGDEFDDVDIRRVGT